MLLVLLASAWLAAGLKHRTDTPKHPDHITILVMLAAPPDRFHVGDSATLTGYVAGVRHEADGDYHIELAQKASATRAHSVVCEIVPTHPLKPPTKGKRVSITGWVYWDGHHLHEPGRGTCYELHPVTSIKEAK